MENRFGETNSPRSSKCTQLILKINIFGYLCLSKRSHFVNFLTKEQNLAEQVVAQVVAFMQFVHISNARRETKLGDGVV